MGRAVKAPSKYDLREFFPGNSAFFSPIRSQPYIFAHRRNTHITSLLVFHKFNFKLAGIYIITFKLAVIYIITWQYNLSHRNRNSIARGQKLCQKRYCSSTSLKHHRMPSKKPSRQQLGIPTFKQNSNLESIKSLARISQAHRVLRAAYRDEQSRNDKQTQTDLEDHIEAEIVDNLDVVPQQGNALDIAEVVLQQGIAHGLNRHSWIITGILLALWIRLLL